jgi:glycosyltransferase involved in cell wall biosynthesis
MSQPNPKRIAFFSDILVRNADGAMRTIFQLVDRIDENQVRYYFVTSHLNEPKLQGQVLSSIRLPFHKKYSIVFPYFAKKKLFKALDEWQPDVIHITSPSLLGYIALQYAASRKLPVVTIYHTHFSAYIQFYFSKLPFVVPSVIMFVNKWMRAFYNRCQVVLVPTTAIKQELIETGIHADKLLLWSRGIDMEMFDSQKRNNQLIQNVTGNTNPTIFFAGRIVWEKNLELLIKIFQYARNDEKGWNFIIAGDGPALADLRGLLPGAFFTGALEHASLAIYYASCDVFLLPSPTETFGNVLLEAMASGIPCVAARAGGPLSLIAHGQNGFLCNPADPNQWVEAITFLLENEVAREQMVENAKNKLSKYSWPSVVSQYVDIVSKLR